MFEFGYFFDSNKHPSDKHWRDASLKDWQHFPGGELQRPAEVKITWSSPFQSVITSRGSISSSPWHLLSHPRPCRSLVCLDEQMKWMSGVWEVVQNHSQSVLLGQSVPMSFGTSPGSPCPLPREEGMNSDFILLLTLLDIFRGCNEK